MNDPPTVDSSTWPEVYRRIGCVLCDGVFGPLRTNTGHAPDLAAIPCADCGQTGGMVEVPIPGTWPSEVFDRQAVAALLETRGWRSK